MQRIDRELNASLELNRAMLITLEWAMRQSQAEAGLIGYVEEKGLRVMADQGYGEEVKAYKEDLMPLDHPAINGTIQTGLAQHATLDTPDPSRSFLIGARSQMVIPITVSSGQAQYPQDAETRVRRAFPRLFYLEAPGLATHAGNLKCSNLVVVGALSKGLNLPLEAWHEAVRQSVKPKFVEVNLRAFQLGQAQGGQLISRAAAYEE